jgi:hypothetical protein
VIRVVVAEEEQERHRAVAAHQLRVDVDSLRRELVVVGARVGRLERAAACRLLWRGSKLRPPDRPRLIGRASNASLWEYGIA